MEQLPNGLSEKIKDLYLFHEELTKFSRDNFVWVVAIERLYTHMKKRDFLKEMTLIDFCNNLQWLNTLNWITLREKRDDLRSDRTNIFVVFNRNGKVEH